MSLRGYLGFGSAVVVIIVATVHFDWPSLPHRFTPPPPKAVRYLSPPPGVVELDRSHYWIKDGFAENAWHLCQHGVKNVDHSHLDDANNNLYGRYQLTGGAVVVCNSDNDHYLFKTPKLGG